MDSELNKLLTDVERALDDWVATYASEFCDSVAVKEAKERIYKNGGTLSYVTDLRERVHSFNKTK